tara:strand:- start:430 stop:696 length:267 start_codon:yes stop_codon:yes gene_type:complete
MTKNDSLIEFPTDFPLKIIGKPENNFQENILEIVKRHDESFDPIDAEMRFSKSNQYISITCTIKANSKRQLDALYHELSKFPQAIMVF